MELLIFFLVLAASWFVGVCAWVQIIGSIILIRRRTPIRLFTIFLWSGIIVGTFFLVKSIAKDQILPWCIGMFISILNVYSSSDAIKQEAQEYERKIGSFFGEEQEPMQEEKVQTRHRRSERWGRRGRICSIPLLWRILISGCVPAAVLFLFPGAEYTVTEWIVRRGAQGPNVRSVEYASVVGSTRYTMCFLLFLIVFIILCIPKKQNMR